MTYIRKRPEIEGRIYMRHLREADMCANGSRKILIEYFNLSADEVSDFFKYGMAFEEFVQRFGHDAMAKQVIVLYEGEQNGQG